MRKNIKKKIAAAAVAGIAASAYANEMPTSNLNPAYAPSNVQAQLRLNVKPDAEILHFIRDTKDPKIVTRTYVLKNADPYEIRGYLRSLVQTTRVNYNLVPNLVGNAKTGTVSNDQNVANNAYWNFYTACPTGVECMKLMDGTSLLMVAAEDYRFKDSTNGMGIDAIVEKLDAPGIKNSTGGPKYIYFPKNRSATELLNMVKLVGANVSSDTTELIGGKDKFETDSALNCIFFNTALYSRKNIESMLRIYDVPNPEVRVKYTVYELFGENDGKIGADFQSWKNNEGADFFSTGARYRDTWSNVNSNGLVRNGGSDDIQFFNFNPKWNSRYLDFLVSKSKAKVAFTGELRSKNNNKSTLSRTTGMFYADYTNDVNRSAHAVSTYVGSGTFSSATDFHGEAITMVGGTSVAVAVITDTSAPASGTPPVNANTVYVLTALNGARFRVGDRDCGDSVQAKTFTPTSAITYAQIYTENQSGKKIEVVKTPNSFLFNMAVSPSVTENGTTLDVELSCTSAMGYGANGLPRSFRAGTTSGSPVQTRVMLGNGKGRFIIGGLMKEEVVRGVGGVPFLKDLPVLGWAFSTETESTKRSQVVIVAECDVVRPATPLPSGIEGEIKSVMDAIGPNVGDSNSYGYRQYLLDDRK